MANFKNILIRFPNWLGDAVNGTIILTPLRQAFPDSKISILIKKNLTDLFHDCRLIDQVIPLSPQQSLLSQVRLLRKARYDLGIILPRSFSSALLFFLGNVKNRIGFSTEGRRFLLNQTVADPNPRRRIHITQEYRSIISSFVPPSSAELHPQIILEKPVYHRHFSSISENSETIIGICADALYGPAKRWPVQYFIELIQLIQKNYRNIKFVLLGLDQEVVRPILDAVPEVMSGVGHLQLYEVMQMIKKCSLLISNDTGLMHLAAGLGTPVIGLFGSTNPDWTRPLGKNSRVLYLHYPCSPCYLKKCPIGLPCLYKIYPAQVYAEIKKLHLTDPETRL